MYKIYFEPPQNGIIKIDNKLISEFPYEYKYEKPILVEYFSTNKNFENFTDLIKIENNKLICSENLSLTYWTNTIFSFNYLPKIKKVYDLKMTSSIQFEEATKNGYAIIIKDTIYHLFIYLDDTLVYCYSLPDYVIEPEVECSFPFFMVTAKTVYNKKYINILYYDDEIKNLLEKQVDSCSLTNNCLELTYIYNDSFNRVVNYNIDFQNDKTTQSIIYSHENKEKNLAKLFIEAYIAKDQKKLVSYLNNDLITDFENYENYLKTLYLPKFCPLKNEENKIYVLNKVKNICLVKNFSCTIENGKITYFELEN